MMPAELLLIRLPELLLAIRFYGFYFNHFFFGRHPGDRSQNGTGYRKRLGVADREKFGIRWTTFVMVCLFIANMGTIAAEFAGVAGALEIFNIPRLLTIPIAVILYLSFGNQVEF